MRLTLARKTGAFALLTLVLVLVDFLTKLWALDVLRESPMGYMPAVPGLFGFLFVWNEGMAFSLFRENPFLITAVSSIIIIALGIVIFLTRLMTYRVRLAACFIFAGGLGNLIDRLRFHAVVDFINIELFSFPVFNFADICVTVGAVMYALTLFFPAGRRKSA